jgi:hypothetical protein
MSNFVLDDTDEFEKPCKNGYYECSACGWKSHTGHPTMTYSVADIELAKERNHSTQHQLELNWVEVEVVNG